MESERLKEELKVAVSLLKMRLRVEDKRTFNFKQIETKLQEIVKLEAAAKKNDHYVEELETQVRSMKGKIEEFSELSESVKSINDRLKTQLQEAQSIIQEKENYIENIRFM